MDRLVFSSMRDELLKLAARAKQLRLPFKPYPTQPTDPTKTKRQMDIDLWHRWDDQGRKPEHLEPLIDRFEPIITSKMKQWKPPMAQEEAFRTELRKQVVKALRTYNPSLGNAVSTHVVARMPAAMRWGNQHANAAYIPEGKTQHIGQLLATQEELREELGRDPTHEELAHATGLAIRHVQKTMGAMRRDVLSSSFASDPTPKESPRHMEIIEQLPEVLPDNLHREVFYHMYGLEGRKKIESPGAIAKQIGKNSSQVARMRTTILNIYKKNL
jgi:DNA-directed RNA polymerase specialized sigma subunit